MSTRHRLTPKQKTECRAPQMGLLPLIKIRGTRKSPSLPVNFAGACEIVLQKHSKMKCSEIIPSSSIYIYIYNIITFFLNKYIYIYIYIYILYLHLIPPTDLFFVGSNKFLHLSGRKFHRSKWRMCIVASDGWQKNLSPAKKNTSEPSTGGDGVTFSRQKWICLRNNYLAILRS